MSSGGEQSTYHKVLRTIKTSDNGASVKELCTDLGLSPMSVRRQLSLLEAEGLVFSTTVKRKTGRPNYRFFLTPSGHERFRRDYAGLALALLKGMRDSEGKERIEGLFKSIARKDASDCRRKVGGHTLEARVHEVAEILTEKGFMASWERLDGGRFLIKEMNCPVEQVARRFPQVCIAEEVFLSELLGARVTRRDHILRRKHFCSYLVEV